MAKALDCDLGGSLVLRQGRPGAGRGPHGPCGVALPSLPARAGIAPCPQLPPSQLRATTTPAGPLAYGKRMRPPAPSVPRAPRPFGLCSSDPPGRPLPVARPGTPFPVGLRAAHAPCGQRGEVEGGRGAAQVPVCAGCGLALRGGAASAPAQHYGPGRGRAAGEGPQVHGEGPQRLAVAGVGTRVCGGQPAGGARDEEGLRGSWGQWGGGPRAGGQAAWACWAGGGSSSCGAGGR